MDSKNGQVVQRRECQELQRKYSDYRAKVKAHIQGVICLACLGVSFYRKEQRGNKFGSPGRAQLQKAILVLVSRIVQSQRF